MAVIIENDKLVVTINEYGAELVELINKDTNKNYIWSADHKYWSYHFPILFPIVGNLKDGIYRVDGLSYNLPKDGFSKILNFDVISQYPDQAILELHSSDYTKKSYPYDFILRIIYKLLNNKLQITYEVENPSEESIWFSIGAYPSFRIPIDNASYYDDYSIKLFPKANRNIIPLKNGMVDINHLKEERSSEIMINHQIFKKNAIILDLGQEPTNINLFSYKIPDRYGVVLKTFNAKFLYIWSSPSEGQFICIAPLWGISDTIDSDQNFKHKFSNNILNSHNIFRAKYEILTF